MEEVGLIMLHFNSCIDGDVTGFASSARLCLGLFLSTGYEKVLMTRKKIVKTAMNLEDRHELNIQ